MSHEAAMRELHAAIETFTHTTGLHAVCVFVEFANGRGRVFSTGSPFAPEDTAKILTTAAQAVLDDRVDIHAGVALAEQAGARMTVIDANTIKKERGRG